MSKELNTEYRRILKDDLPDLWGRIEASLPDKNTAGTSQQTDIRPISPSPKKKTSVYRFMPAIAACACAAVLIPVILISNSNKNRSYETASSAAFEGAFMKDLAAAEADIGMNSSEKAAAPIMPAEAVYEAAEESAYEAATMPEQAYDSAGDMENAAQYTPDVFRSVGLSIKDPVEIDTGEKGFYAVLTSDLPEYYLFKGDTVIILADKDILPADKNAPSDDVSLDIEPVWVYETVPVFRIVPKN